MQSHDTKLLKAVKHALHQDAQFQTIVQDAQVCQVLCNALPYDKLHAARQSFCRSAIL